MFHMAMEHSRYYNRAGAYVAVSHHDSLQYQRERQETYEREERDERRTRERREMYKREERDVQEREERDVLEREERRTRERGERCTEREDRQARSPRERKEKGVLIGSEQANDSGPMGSLAFVLEIPYQLKDDNLLSPKLTYNCHSCMIYAILMEENRYIVSRYIQRHY